AASRPSPSAICTGEGGWLMAGIRRIDPPPPAMNCAELLIDLGRGVRQMMRRGAGLEEVSRHVRSTPAQCRLALAFLEQSDRVKLRSMVEDWSYRRIVEEVARTIRAREISVES